MTREEIIKYLDKTPTADNFYYDILKECLSIKFFYGEENYHLTCREIDQFSNCRIDEWFKGIIYSLYYRPNHTVLVLVGHQAIGKTQFFRQLLPQKEWYTNCYGKEAIYYNLICNFDEGMLKSQLTLANQDNFMIRQLYSHQSSAEKRLCSFCSTTNVKQWRHPPRKNFIVLNVESINQELFNSIDKHLLWIEIFNKFKPTDK